MFMDQRSGGGRFSGRTIFKSSRSIRGCHFQDFEKLDAKIALALNEIIQNASFNKKVSLKEPKAQLQERFLRRRQIAFMIHEYSRVTGGYDTVLEYADLSSIIFATMMFRSLIKFGMKFCYQ